MANISTTKPAEIIEKLMIDNKLYKNISKQNVIPIPTGNYYCSYAVLIKFFQG